MKKLIKTTLALVFLLSVSACQEDIMPTLEESEIVSFEPDDLQGETNNGEEPEGKDIR